MLAPYEKMMGEAGNFFTVVSADYGLVMERTVDMFVDGKNHIVSCKHDKLFPVQDDISVTSDFDHESHLAEPHLQTSIASQNLTSVWKYWANLIYLDGQFPSLDKYKYQILTWAKSDH